MMNMRTVYFSLFIVILLFSCKNESNSLVTNDILSLEESIKSSPSDKLYADLNDKYHEMFDDKRLNSDKKEKILERAFNYFNSAGKYGIASSYMTELLKDFAGDKSQGRIKELINLFDNKKVDGVSKVIKKLYSIKYPEDKGTIEKYQNDIKDVEPDFGKFIKGVGESIFASLEKTGKLNVKAAKDYVNYCEAFVLINPNEELSPEYIFKAAEVAHTIKSYNKTFELYDWLLEKYPNYSKSSTALFLKGYIFDNELKRYEDATKLYDEFLMKYPESDLVDDVKTLKEFMGKSDKEILELIEKSSKKEK